MTIFDSERGAKPTHVSGASRPVHPMGTVTVRATSSHSRRRHFSTRRRERGETTAATVRPDAA